MNVAWRVLARAEVTKRLAHGDRYLETRLFLSDGRVLEQVNPGVPDVENGWREVGRFTDLDAALRQLRRDGWEIRPQSEGALRYRAILLLVVVAIVAAVAVAIALTPRS